MQSALPAQAPLGLDNARIAIIGLGYVGLPLAAAFGKRYPVVGFDIDTQRVAELKTFHDRTLETSEDELRAFVQGKLARYKAPKRILFKDNLGRASNGKADYKSIKAFALAELGING